MSDLGILPSPVAETQPESETNEEESETEDEEFEPEPEVILVPVENVRSQLKTLVAQGILIVTSFIYAVGIFAIATL